MKSSVSEQSLYIESEDEDEEKEFTKGEQEGDDSDTSNDDSTQNQQKSKPDSLNTTWPQSYRQSIDLYSSVPSPNITFLGTPTISRLSGSVLSSSLKRRHTPEIFPYAAKPLLPTVVDEQQPQQRRSSHSLLPPLPSTKASAKKSTKADSHEIPATRQSSYGQAVLNGMNVLCGVGILSTPYAVKEGGWVGISVLFIFAALSYYTGLLLRYCLDSQPGLETYPDIGQAAFGTAGRLTISWCLLMSREAVSFVNFLCYDDDGVVFLDVAGGVDRIILYAELYACCVEHIILESDNLSALFPNAQLNLGAYELNSHHLFAVLTAIAVLPTVWLRDLSVLSYISAGGVIASILVVICLFWVGLVDKISFEQSKGTTLNLTTLPVAIGLYGYCYSGHAVFPNIYTSMEKPSQYPAVLLTSFGICTLMYAGVAVMGYMMFGELTLSQFTLNMPQHLVASKIAVWTTVVNPFTKYPFHNRVSWFCYIRELFRTLNSMLNYIQEFSRIFLNHEYICIDDDSSSNESRGIDTIKPSQISHLFNPHQNSAGDFYFGCEPHHPLLWVGDGIHWIFTHNASDLDTSLCLFYEHLEGENNSTSGIAVHIDHSSRCGISGLWNLLLTLSNYKKFELKKLFQSEGNQFRISQTCYYLYGFIPQ
ncbi:hypothetical protein C3L33_22357, partial [Rhododendron williamsianum]